MANDACATLRYVWITVGLAVFGTGWYLVFAANGTGPVAVGYLVLPVGTAVAGLAVHRLGTTALEPVARRFWRRLLCATALLTLGYGMLAADVALHTTAGVPPAMSVPAAGCVALGLIVAIWAVVRVPLGAASRSEGWRLLLDRTIAFLGCATALWHFGLAPMLTAPQRWSAQVLSLVALAFLLAIGGITKVSYLGPGPVDRTAIRLIAAIGLTAAAVAVLAVTYGHAGGLPAQTIVMPIGPVLATLAVRAQARSAGADRRTYGLLPYLAVVAVDVPLLLVATGPMDWSGRVVVVAAVAVTALVTVRQFLASRENVRLLRERRAQEERLRHEVTHDELTGLANRALFHDRLRAALRDERGATVLLVDLDDFKTVNDSLGHDVGDRLLVSMAAALRTAVADNGLAVRISGDEFAVLLPGGGPLGETVAADVIDVLSEPIGEHRLLIQASIGISTATAGGSLDSVLREADVAMYAAKQRGKAGYLRYLPGMEEPVLAHIQLGGELRRALDEGEFRVVYQPVMGLADGRVVGVEALVRWDHPTRGTVSPAEFIPAAERTGLIVPLGRYVLRETCRQGAAWLAEFGDAAMQKVAANVSARQLHDPDFGADVVAALADSGLSSDRLVLELTESAVLRGRQVSRTLHELDRMGVKLALDDFGTGESSLSLLRSFPAAIIKLDKSFVDGIESDDPCPTTRSAREAVARAVIQLAGALGLDAVAEGIEHPGQVRRLRELGYTLGQGFHLGRPMSADHIGKLLAGQRLPAVAG